MHTPVVTNNLFAPNREQIREGQSTKTKLPQILCIHTWTQLKMPTWQFVVIEIIYHLGYGPVISLAPIMKHYSLNTIPPLDISAHYPSLSIGINKKCTLLHRQAMSFFTVRVLFILYMHQDSLLYYDMYIYIYIYIYITACQYGDY